MPPASRGLRALLVASGLGLLGVFTGLRLIDGAAGSSPRRPETPAPVVVVAVSRGEFTERIEALGTAQANESVVITARVTETVATLNFEDGQAVRRGDVLAVLTNDEEAAQLQEERSLYADAQKQYRRISDLLAQGSAPQSQLDSVTARRDAARARMEELEARLADRLIRAPFDGVLGLRALSQGSLVQPGDTITTLDDIDMIKLDFSVPETFLALLRPGLEIQARSAAYPGELFSGIVRSVELRVDPVTRSVRVRASIPNPGHRLRPGMLLTVDLIKDRRESLSIPEQAVVPVGDRKFVFVVNGEERAERVEIVTGRRRPGAVEVIRGLAEGDRVVAEGGAQLRSGRPVRVATPSAPDPG